MYARKFVTSVGLPGNVVAPEQDGLHRAFRQLAAVARLSCLVAFAAAAVGCIDTESEEPSGIATVDTDTAGFSAQIQRTAFGIPHITAQDEKGLGFGAGYAFAQDNICMLAEEVVTVNGERSLYFGPNATYEPSSDGTTIHNLPSDVFFAVTNAPSRVIASWKEQPLEIQDLILGYAHGVNHYLRVAGGALPEACRAQPWVREITELDVVRIMRRFAVEASGERVIEAIFAASPPLGPIIETSGEQPVMRGVELARSEVWERFHTTLGSNAIALGRDVSDSRAGTLLANPHFPWRGVFRFYQLHLIIPGQVDAMGATPVGLPVVGIGHNAHVAWTHTVNSSRHFTFHKLKLDTASPTRYVVDGQSRPMAATDVKVKVRLPNGDTAAVTHRVWSTEFGPVFVIPGSFGWTGGASGTAFAFGDANADNTRFLQTWWAMAHSTTLTELRAAVEQTLGIPWVNTIAVDAGGTTYLGDVTPVPNVPSDKTCIPDGFGPSADTGQVVLDASRSSCGWQVVPGTPTPGIVPGANLPSIMRTDFVQNSNDSPWLANPAAPLTGFPAIVSRERNEQTPRTRLGLTFLTGEIAAGRRISARGLLDFAFSNRSLFAQTLLPDLRKLCSSTCDDSVASTCRLLAHWDGTANVDSVGWPVFLAWRQALEASAKTSALSTARVPFDPLNPITTPRGLQLGNDAVENAAHTALVNAASVVASQGLDPNRPWGQQQQSKRNGKLIPIHGGGDGRTSEAGNDIYNKIFSKFTEGRLEPFYGSSIVMAISFENGVPSAQGVLTYSQSSDPASPHYGDQTERFSRKDWISFPYTQAAIEADPELTVEDITE